MKKPLFPFKISFIKIYLYYFYFLFFHQTSRQSINELDRQRRDLLRKIKDDGTMSQEEDAYDDENVCDINKHNNNPNNVNVVQRTSNFGIGTRA
jgi:hypothetical protein